MEICYKYKNFIKNGRFQDLIELKMRRNFRILDIKKSFTYDNKKWRNTHEYRNV